MKEEITSDSEHYESIIKMFENSKVSFSAMKVFARLADCVHSVPIIINGSPKFLEFHKNVCYLTNR